MYCFHTVNTDIHASGASGARYARIHDMNAVVGTTRWEVISPPRCISLSLHEMVGEGELRGGEFRRSLRRGCSSLWICSLLPPEEGAVLLSSFPMFAVVVVYFRCSLIWFSEVTCQFLRTACFRKFLVLFCIPGIPDVLILIM